MIPPITLVNRRNQISVGSQIKVADHYFARLKGLLGVKQLDLGQGLLITPCKSVHMFFMQISLDIVFLDKERQVVHLIENLKPWQISPVIKQAASCLELPVGQIQQAEIELGDFLDLG